MAKPERPKSRLPDGRVSPEYTAWRKKHVLKEKPQAVLTEAKLDEVIAKVFSGPQKPLVLEVSDPKAIKLLERIRANEPEILSLRCVKLARNSLFVHCAHGEGMVAVRVKRGLGKKLLKKNIKVSVDGETYTHIR